MITKGTTSLAALFVLALAGCSDSDGKPGDGGLDGGDAQAGSGSGTAGGSGTRGAGNSGSTAGTRAQQDGGPGSDEDGGPGGGGGGSMASGDSGDPPGGSTDASTTDAGPGTTTPPGCTSLAECCATLADPDRAGCEIIADNADDAMCEQLQTVFCAPDPGDDGSCGALQTCCESLPRGPVRVACASTVVNGTPLECEQLTLALCPTDGDPSACAALADCCDGLPPPQAMACDMIVDQGVAFSCETVDALFCP